MAALERVILTTGGTGGHIFPALAAAEEIRARNPGARVLFVGAHGPEGELARKAGLEFAALPARGVLGKGLSSLAAPVWIGRGLLKAAGLIRSFRPQVVAGFGGYAGFCAVFAAAMLRSPTAIHEQNAVPGLANRMLGKVVHRVLLSFPDEGNSFSAGKRLVVGNPVRAAIRSLRGRPRPAGRGGRNLLVLGGSQGARALSEAVVASAGTLLELGANLRLMTGPRDFERVRERCRELGLPRDAQAFQVSSFIEDMAEAYAWADLVLCRAGATTAAELTAAGKPAVFMPFPYATHGHQLANARALEKAGAALVVEEKDLPGTDLPGLIMDLLGDRPRIDAMAAASARQGRPDAAAELVDELQRIAARILRS